MELEQDVASLGHVRRYLKDDTRLPNLHCSRGHHRRLESSGVAGARHSKSVNPPFMR